LIAWIDAIEANTFHAISRQQIPNNFIAALCEPYRHRSSSEISVQQGMSKLKKKDENSPSEVGSGSKALPKRRKGRAPFVDGKMKQIVKDNLKQVLVKLGNISDVIVKRNIELQGEDAPTPLVVDALAKANEAFKLLENK
jgi:hypothetical protein